jgi:hypothetical protein
MDRWAGLLNYGSSENHTITLAMSRIEDWDFASDGIGCDANADNGTLAAKHPGTYFIDFTASVKADAAADIIFEIYRNGEPIYLGAEVTIDAADDIEQVSIIGAYRLRVGDVLAVYARADGEYSVDIPYAQFGIMSLSGRRWS